MFLNRHALLFLFCFNVQKSKSTSITFGVANGSFTLNGNPYRFVSGSLHYFRVPHQFWKDRLHKLRSAGLQAVSTYVEWSFHEEHEGQYRWLGDQDLVKFVRLAQEEGLFVLLRPGPFISAERDLGGLPHWLLGKYPRIRLRSTDSDFLREVKKWFDVLFKRVTPFLIGNGGPIILVQVENEYGSVEKCEKGYMVAIKDLLKAHVGSNALLYTTDDLKGLKCGPVSGAITTIDFGTGHNISKEFGELNKLFPESPPMNAEFYTGWINHWGDKFQRVSSEIIATDLQTMLAYGANVNFYVFHGGTNFGFTSDATDIIFFITNEDKQGIELYSNAELYFLESLLEHIFIADRFNGEISAGGANFPPFGPDITSYDYDAPLSEAGDITEKFMKIRGVMEKYFEDVKTLPIPQNSPKGAYGIVVLKPQLHLLSERGKEALGVSKEPYFGSKLPTFEFLRQKGGMILYQHRLRTTGKFDQLTINSLHDYAYIYVDGQFYASMDRIGKNYKTFIDYNRNSSLSILVEHLGRINHGKNMNEFKGILGSVVLGNWTLKSKWNITCFPLDDVSTEATDYVEATRKGPILFRSEFVLPQGEEPKDTYINTDGWMKGFIWINGHNIGRYWPIRSTQVTLYVPGVYLKPAPHINILKVLEHDYAPTTLTMEFIDQPIFNN